MNKSVKKKIIHSAFELFQKNGYNETTIHDICDACNITKPTFYRYLSSKEEILMYFFDQLNDDLGELIVYLTNSDNYYHQLLHAFDLVLNRMNVFGKDLYAQLYIANLKEYNGTFDEIESFKKIILAIITKAQQHKQIRNTSCAESLYEVCSTLCFGCGIKWCMNLIEDPKQAFSQQLSTLLEVEEAYR